MKSNYLRVVQKVEFECKMCSDACQSHPSLLDKKVSTQQLQVFRLFMSLHNCICINAKGNNFL